VQIKALSLDGLTGDYLWSWQSGSGSLSAPTRQLTNLSLDDTPNNYRSLHFAFTPESAQAPTVSLKEVCRCISSITDTNTADWCSAHAQHRSTCLNAGLTDCLAGEWCNVHTQEFWVCRDHGIDPAICHPVEGSSSAPELFSLAVNNDDDNADSQLDNTATCQISDDDLKASYPASPFTGSCCSCPSHASPGAATRISCSAKIRTWDASGASGGTTVQAGEKLYIEGISPSAAVGDEKVVWSVGSNPSHIYTNAYTIYSLRLFGDLNFDDTINSNDYASASSLSLSEYGWPIPVASNTLRKVELKTDVLIPGYLILSLSGTATVRVWTAATPATNDTPLLITGQTVTNGVDGANFAVYPESMIYAEFVSD